MTYTITAPAGRQIHLWFIDFAIFADPANTYDEDYFEYVYTDISNSTDCDNGDYIDVSDVNAGMRKKRRSVRPGSLKFELGDELRMCGFYDPTAESLYASVSSSNQVTVKFHTTTGPKTADNKGFKIFLTDDNGEYNLNITMTEENK